MIETFKGNTFGDLVWNFKNPVIHDHKIKIKKSLFKNVLEIKMYYTKKFKLNIFFLVILIWTVKPIIFTFKED